MKNLKEYFKVVLIKPNGELEVVNYRKDKEHFDGEYAIVKAFSKDIRFANHTWYGIVDREFNTVIPFQLCSKMELFGKHLFVQKRESDYKIVTMHFCLKSDGVRYVNSFQGGYQKVNEDTVLVSSYEGNDMVNLYHIPEEKVVSNSFHQISLFEEKNGNLIALAKRRLEADKTKEVTCYIDVHGDIVSYVHEPLLNKYMSVTKECFPFLIQELENSLPKCDDKENVKKRLYDSVWVRNRF